MCLKQDEADSENRPRSLIPPGADGVADSEHEIVLGAEIEELIAYVEK